MYGKSVRRLRLFIDYAMCNGCGGLFHKDWLDVDLTAPKEGSLCVTCYKKKDDILKEKEGDR